MKSAVRRLFELTKLVVEPSAAVGIAALLEGKVSATGNIVSIISGGNVSKKIFAQLLN